MILSISRAALFQECRRKVDYTYEQRLAPFRIADALLLGGAFHRAAAVYVSSKNVPVAQAAGLDHVLQGMKSAEAWSGQPLLIEELAPYNLLKKQVVAMVAKYAAFYESAEYQIIQPEVKFTVPLPNSWHNCLFTHRMYCTSTFEVCCCHKDKALCWGQHWFHGITDALILWDELIWLLELKTSGIATENFITQFQLDWQPTGYMYGISKQLNLIPHGFLLNIIKKPNKRALDQCNFELIPEPYLRTAEDLQEFEKEFTLLAEDYEDAVVRERLYKNPKSCMNWNRKCSFHDVCLANGTIEEGRFRSNHERREVEEVQYRTAHESDLATWAARRRNT